MTPFILQSSRQVSKMAPGAIHIRNQVDAIEYAMEHSPSSVFDQSKALVDTVCKTILEDRKIGTEDNPDSPKLFKRTLKVLKLHPDEIDETKETSDSIKKTANGLMTTIQGICELRNSNGSIGHGIDGYALSLENIQAQFVALAADALVHILYRCHKEYGDIGTQFRIVYEDYGDENNQIDDSYNDDALMEFIKNFKPSDILYKLDKIAYQDEINNLQNEAAD